MTTERLSMRNVREILRQVWELNRSYREVAGSFGLSLDVRDDRRGILCGGLTGENSDAQG